MTYSQPFFNNTGVISDNIDIPEITVSVCKFKIFDKDFNYITQSNYHKIFQNFFDKLNNYVDYDVAKKEMILEYYTQEHPELTPDKAWAFYSRVPSHCRIESSFNDRLNLEKSIKNVIIEYNRDKKIDDLLK